MIRNRLLLGGHQTASIVPFLLSPLSSSDCALRINPREGSSGHDSVVDSATTHDKSRSGSRSFVSRPALALREGRWGRRSLALSAAHSASRSLPPIVLALEATAGEEEKGDMAALGWSQPWRPHLLSLLLSVPCAGWLLGRERTSVSTTSEHAQQTPVRASTGYGVPALPACEPSAPGSWLSPGTWVIHGSSARSQVSQVPAPSISPTPSTSSSSSRHDGSDQEPRRSI
ncbi:hypothetical protein LZ30DRAFT_704445 [Colletotrichum cereale]|nr:hypothetical protein LZ30DRAFT_704445 [Colletotrichum cereale]